MASKLGEGNGGFAREPGMFRSSVGVAQAAACLVVFVLAFAFAVGVITSAAVEFFELGWGLL